MTDGQTCSISALFFLAASTLIGSCETNSSTERVIVLQQSGNTDIDLLLPFDGVLGDVMGRSLRGVNKRVSS